MSFIEKSYIKNILRSRPAQYRDQINKKEYLLVDRQEFGSNTAKASLKLNRYYEKLDLNHYPQIDKFYKFLSRFIKVKQNKILITEGCTGGIKQIIEGYTKQGQNIIVAYPTFILYSVFTKVNNINLKKVEYDKEFKLNANSYLDKIDKKTSIIFLTNPGAPNDFVLPIKEIEKICITCKKKNIIVALDDAYYPYYNLNLIPLIKRYNNFIVLRTFSKYYGLASLRVGYIAASEKRIEYLSKFRGGYEINSPTIDITQNIIKNKKFFSKKYGDMKKAKVFAMSELKKNNIKIKSFGNANYLCVSVSQNENVAKIANYLFKNKIVVKYDLPSPFKDCILFTLTDIKDVKKILKPLIYAYNRANNWEIVQGIT
tara:strand:+ start:15178 stop:16290 length:1113 start_codon:yes stop_codon:yes gene_type:complete